MISDEEKELEETQAAASKVRALLDDKEKWDDLEVHALELSDATDDLNDAVRRVEAVMRESRVRPGWVPIPLVPTNDHALLWDGKNLIYDDGKNRTALLSSSRERRSIGAMTLLALAAELGRQR